MVELVFSNAFDASLYPILTEKPALSAIVQDKLKSMRTFMDKMKGGVRNMRSMVTFEGASYAVVLKI